jgi:malonyl-CoA/methylmalonyl-CoA synthetase
MNLYLWELAQKYRERNALITPSGNYSYGYLLDYSQQIARKLLAGVTDLSPSPLTPLSKGGRVALMIPPGVDYVATLWGIWQAGGLAVPLCISHPQPELEYVITNSQASVIIAAPEFEGILGAIASQYDLPLILTSQIQDLTTGDLPPVAPHGRALMLYTSGTTGKPKGVVITHGNIQAQVTSLVEAWEWTEGDRILHFLPLHHIHGIINVLTCALWVGAECHILPKFDPETVWECISAGNLTLFMAVPTIYAKLITAWEQAPPEVQKIRSEGCAQMRLMVSGSAALPVKTLAKWQEISSHFLLERYGMTEIGMALSNPLHGQRLAGFVGQSLPGVAVRLVDENGQVNPTMGEIQVKGAGVFQEYWQNPTATAKSFQDGWFCTGDLATVENGSYRILGRISVDIIKTGGYKVSALEIEEILRTHPEIRDCAVVGIPDEEWGERVGVALITEKQLNLESLRNWAKERLAVYKVPTRLLIVDQLPRNAMGKVTKPEVVKLLIKELEIRG